MKVLTFKQPWASLIAMGIKDIENRTWKIPEKYKGERILIHSSGKSWTWEEFYNYIEELDNKELKLQKILRENNFNDKWLKSLPTSSIIGSVVISECMISHPSVWAEKTNFMDLFGRPTYPKKEDIIYNWILSKPILFDKPITNVKGKLNFWDICL